MHAQDHLAQRLVLMAACKEVAGGEEIRISLLIPALEDFCQYIISENTRIIFIGHDACLRVKIEQVEILTHEGLKEGVQCGDLRTRKERDLSLQVADEREVLGGICGLELTGERGGNAGLHLAGCGFCEGQHQELMDACVTFGGCREAGDAFRQDGGLSAARGGG